MSFISLENIQHYKPAPNPSLHISDTPSLLPNTANPTPNYSNQLEAVVATTTTDGFVALSADTQVGALSTASRDDHSLWHIKESTPNTSKINIYQTQFTQENSASETQVFQDSSTIDIQGTRITNPEAVFWSNASDFNTDSDIDLTCFAWNEHEQLPDENPSQIAIQSQHYSHYPIDSSNNQIGEYNYDRNIRCASIRPGIQSLSNPLNRIRRENAETASELSANPSLASEKQEKPLLLTTPILPPHRYHHESPHLQNSQERFQSRISNSRVHEHSSLRVNQSQENQPEARQQCEMVREIVCNSEYHNSAPGQRKSKRRRLDANQENNINHHKVQEEKRQQEENSYDELGCETQEEVIGASEDENQRIDDLSYTISVAGSPSAIPKQQRQTRSNYSSSVSEHDPELASCSLDPSAYNITTSATAPLQSENIPIHGFLTLEILDSEVVYCLKFSQDVLPTANERQRQDTASSNSDWEGLKSCELGKSLTKEQENHLVRLVKANKTWPEIKRRFPGYPLQFLKDNYFIEQNGKPRKRGAKPGSKRKRKYGV